MPPPSLALAFALKLCFPAETADAPCLAPVDDERLAGAVAAVSPARHPDRARAAATETQARDQLRVAGSVAQTQLDIWWFTAGLDMLGESARRGVSRPQAALAPQVAAGAIRLDANLRAATR